MDIRDLLSRLDRVRKTGPDSWSARCPAHDDKGPSLSVRETADGTILVHCFAGCDVARVVGAVDMKLDDLFPPNDTTGAVKGKRRPFPAMAVVESCASEAAVVMVIAGHLFAGKDIPAADRARLGVAVERLQRMIDKVRDGRG